MGTGVFGAGDRGIRIKGVVMRKKAGKAVIYFLVLMLCCTVAARAASSITVAKVKTAKVGKGVLTQLVTGSGTVTAKEQYSQSLPEGQKVKKVLVKPQTTVEAGQALIQLDMDYLAEKIEEKSREIEKLNLQLEQQKLAGQEDARTPETAQAQIALNNAEILLEQAQADYDQAAAEYENLVNDPPAADSGQTQNGGLDSGQDVDQGEGPDTAGQTSQGGNSSGAGEYEKWEQEVQAAKDKMQSAADTLNSQAISYNQAVEQYELASQNEANTRQNEEKKKKSNTLTVEGIQVDIEGAQAALKKLTDIQNAEGIVSAASSGIFQSAGVTEGDVTAGTEQIIIASQAAEAKGLIDQADVGKIQEGDKISIKFSGNTDTLEVKAERFEQVSAQETPSKEEEGQAGSGGMVWYGQAGEKELKTGTSFTYEASKESGSYEQVIPLSALHQAQGQTFVLTAEARDGILGQVYTAVSVPVTVLDKDDKSAAVKSALNNKSLIIVESSKYVEEGNQVRLE